MDAANIKIDSKKLSDAMVYSDAGMWSNSFDLVEGIPDDSVQDLIQWLKLREGEGSKLDYINFIKENPHLMVSLLFLDFDLYEPTKCALENFLPRMPLGGIIAFDELDNPLWPGETLAMLESHSKYNFEIARILGQRRLCNFTTL